MTSAQRSRMEGISANLPKSQEPKKFLHLTERQNPPGVSNTQHRKHVAPRLRLSAISKSALGENGKSAFVSVQTSSCLSGMDSSRSCPSTGQQPDSSLVLRPAAQPRRSPQYQDTTSTNQPVSSICSVGDSQRLRPIIRQLNVSRPDFFRNSSKVIETQPKKLPLHTKFKSTSNCDDRKSLAEVSNLQQTRASQMEALGKLLNQDLTSQVMVPFQRHSRAKLMTTGPKASVCASTTD